MATGTWPPATTPDVRRGSGDRCRPIAHIHASQRVALMTGALGRAIPKQTFVDCGLGCVAAMDHRRNTRDDIADASTIARCRQPLGDEADGLSDYGIDQMRRHAEAVAHVIVEMFLEQRTAQE